MGMRPRIRNIRGSTGIRKSHYIERAPVARRITAIVRFEHLKDEFLKIIRIADSKEGDKRVLLAKAVVGFCANHEFKIHFIMKEYVQKGRDQDLLEAISKVPKRPGVVVRFAKEE